MQGGGRDRKEEMRERETANWNEIIEEREKRSGERLGRERSKGTREQ